MRQHKYRVFVKNDKHTEDGMYFVDLKDEVTPFDCRIMQEYELMQFTWLLDQNGKEIYEGDIVNNDQSKLLNYPLIVCWHNDMSAYVLKKSIYTHEFIQICEISSQWQLEVIDNIYENPNLLPN